VKNFEKKFNNEYEKYLKKLIILSDNYDKSNIDKYSKQRKLLTKEFVLKFLKTDKEKK
jgi:hypothetical protein